MCAERGRVLDLGQREATHTDADTSEVGESLDGDGGCAVRLVLVDERRELPRRRGKLVLRIDDLLVERDGIRPDFARGDTDHGRENGHRDGSDEAQRGTELVHHAHFSFQGVCGELISLPLNTKSIFDLRLPPVD